MLLQLITTPDTNKKNLKRTFTKNMITRDTKNIWISMGDLKSCSQNVMNEWIILDVPTYIVKYYSIW
jgi:hypothetical protein